MPSEETIELIHIRNTQGLLTDIPSDNATASISAKIKDLLLSASNLPLLKHIFGGSFPNKSLTLGVGDNNAISIFSDGIFLYAGLTTSPGKIVKIALSTFTIYDTLTFNIGENIVNGLVSDGSKLYATLQTGEVVKIDLQTFSRESTISLGFVMSGLYLDGTYLYATSTLKVTRIDVDTFTTISSLVLVAPERIISSITGDGEYLYLGCHDPTFASRIVRVDISTFAKVDTLILNTLPIAQIVNIIIHGKYIYAYVQGPFLATDHQIIKIDLYTFTIISILTILKATYGNTITSIVSDGTYIYAGTIKNAATSYIVIVDLASFIIKQIITVPTIGRLFIVPPFLFSTSFDSPSIVTRHYLLPYSTSTNIQTSIIHEQTRTGTYYIIPSNTVGITITSGAGLYTKGAYTEIIATNAITTDFFIDSIHLYNQTINRDFEIDIATGAALSEVIVATVSNSVSHIQESREPRFGSQIKIPANTRISARCSDSDIAGTGTVRVKIRYRI